MTIPTIGVRDIYVPNVYVPTWLNATPNVDHLIPPVVLYLSPLLVLAVTYSYARMRLSKTSKVK